MFKSKTILVPDDIAAYRPHNVIGLINEECGFPASVTVGQRLNPRQYPVDDILAYYPNSNSTWQTMRLSNGAIVKAFVHVSPSSGVLKKPVTLTVDWED